MAHRLEYAPQSPNLVQASKILVVVDLPDGDRLVFKTIVQPRRQRICLPPVCCCCYRRCIACGLVVVMPCRDAFRPGQLSGPSTAIIVVVVEPHRDGLSLFLLASLPSWVPCLPSALLLLGCWRCLRARSCCCWHECSVTSGCCFSYLKHCTAHAMFNKIH